MKTAILLFKIWTLSFSSFYLPTDRDSSVSIDTPDGVHCRASFEHNRIVLKLKCEKDLKTILYYEDATPEVRATMMVDGLLVKIGP